MDVSYIISIYLLTASLSCIATEDTMQEDTGQCIPIYCDLGVPPEKCTSLCRLQKYVPICQEPANICVCQKLVNNRIELVSPDEVEAPTSKSQVDSGSIRMLMNIFAYITPLENSKLSVEEDSYVIETVNVHDGPLFYAFSYILSGLFILMICLIVYELFMCRQMNSSSTEQLIERNIVTKI